MSRLQFVPPLAWWEKVLIIFGTDRYWTDILRRHRILVVGENDEKYKS